MFAAIDVKVCQEFHSLLVKIHLSVSLAASLGDTTRLCDLNGPSCPGPPTPTLLPGIPGPALEGLWPQDPSTDLPGGSPWATLARRIPGLPGLVPSPLPPPPSLSQPFSFLDFGGPLQQGFWED